MQHLQHCPHPMLQINACVTRLLLISKRAHLFTKYTVLVLTGAHNNKERQTALYWLEHLLSNSSLEIVLIWQLALEVQVCATV